MKTLRSIFIRSGINPIALALPMAICMSGLTAHAQDYYDDDLYYDASKAKKEVPKVTTAPATSQPGSQPPQPSASAMYYYDGAAYVPWDSVGDFLPASSYLPQAAGSTRDVDEYNRRGAAYAPTASMPDSISLQEFEDMSATEYLARFGDSQIARETLASANVNNYTDVYNAGYSSGYDAGYNANPSTSLSINFGVGYPYGYYPYYNAWGWPYYSWRNPYYWYSPSWAWGWDYPAWSWGWNWGWTSPSWAWGWGYPGYYPGYYPGWGGYYRPSPSAAHRPRSTGYNYGAAGSRGGRYDHAAPGSSSRPGYRPPSSGSQAGTPNGGYYGGSASGRNSHFGTTGTPGYRPATGNNSGSGHNGYSRPAGTSNGYHNNGNFGASQSTRNGSYNNNSNYNSNRSGNYNSNRSSGGFSGGSRSGGYSGGGRSGGGGHRSR